MTEFEIAALAQLAKMVNIVQEDRLRAEVRHRDLLEALREIELSCDEITQSVERLADLTVAQGKKI